MERVKGLSFWNGAEPTIKAVGDVREELQLGEGRTNENFIVDCNGQRSFVRIGGDLPYFGVSRPREHAASRAGEAAGVAPKVLHTELPDVLVVNFVQGRALTEEDAHKACADKDNSLLKDITTAIRKLHAAPIPEELTKFSDEVSKAAHIGVSGPHFAKWLHYAEEQGYSRLPLLTGIHDFIASLESAAEPLVKDAKISFCHFDLLSDNFVLQSEGGILLVDFEYAAPGYPAMDLAVLAMGCSLTSDEERNLLSSYLQADATESQVHAFKAIRVLAALRETFWGVTAELSKSSALSMEEATSYCDMNCGKLQQLRAEFESLPKPNA